MKKQFTLLLIGAFAFCLVFPNLSSAQESGESITVIQEIKHDDGTVTTVKKRLTGAESVEDYFKSLPEGTEGAEVDIRVVVEGQDGEPSEVGDEAPIFFFRRAHSDQNNEELEEVRVYLNGEEQAIQRVIEAELQGHSTGQHPRIKRIKATKPFLGIYPSDTEDNAGVLVNGIVNGSGAEAGGLQQGDVITAIAGYGTNGRYGLRGVLRKLEPGQQVKVNLIRDGQPQSLNVTLGEKAYMRTVLNEEREPCDVFIGVYVGGTGPNGTGVQVTDIIGGTPAEKYGLQAGDVILAMDGIEVTGNGELLTERDKHEPGEAFTLTIQRGEAVQDIGAQFLLCENQPEEAPAVVEEAPVMELPETRLQLKGYRAFPNPSYGQIRVQFTGEQAPVLVQITDATGRVIHRTQLNRFDGYFDEQIDLSSATPGNLFLTIQQNDKQVTKQLVLINRV